MRGLKTLILIVLIATSYGSFGTPVISAATKAKLYQVIKLEQDFVNDIIERGASWHFKYTLLTESYNQHKKKFEIIRTNGELIASKKFRYMNTENMEMCMNDNEVITILKQQKLVTKIPSTKEALESMTNEYSSMLRDSFFRQFNLHSVSSVDESGQKLLRYHFIPKDKPKSVYTQMTIFISERDNTLRKVYMEYSPSSRREVKASTMIIEKREELRNGFDFGVFKRRVFSGNGVLSSAYRGYKYRVRRAN